MRPVLFLVLILFAGCLVACGGGGGGSLVQGKATLDGGVSEVDGSTSGLGGIALVLVETGEQVVTLPDGGFRFKSAPVGSFTVALAAAPAAAPQAYTDKCSICHGSDGSGPPNARGKTDAQFAAALTRGGMAAISLTPPEYDAVFAFLTDVAAPPPPPAPNPDPVPPTPDDNDGQAQYRAHCAACHGDFGIPANAAGGDRQVLGARVCSIEGSIDGTSVFPGGVPAMAGLKSLSAAQIESIAEYLNSQPVTGQERYVTNCAGCHGMTGDGGRTGEGVRGESASETREAIADESEMRYLDCLPAADIDQISAYLQGLDDSPDDDDDDDDGKSGKSDDDDDDDGDDGKSGKSEDDDDDGKSGKSAKSEADEIDDGDESDEDEVSLHRVRAGEHIHLKLRIRNGRLERVDLSRSGGDEREVEVCLSRTEGNDDPDMKGCLEVEQREDRERFELEVEHAAPGRDLELFVIDPDGGEESQGVLTVGLDGEAEWELRGAGLPFGAASVADLEGYEVVVRDALDRTDLLIGKVPELPDSAPAPDAGNGDEDDEDGGRMRGKARLTAHGEPVEGYVEIRSDAEDARERFEMEAEHLAVGRSVEFFLEDAAKPGTFVSLGTRSADLEGEAELELDTGDGAGLPNGAAAVSELVGLAVEIRDASTAALLLDGIVPALKQD